MVTLLIKLYADHHDIFENLKNVLRLYPETKN